MENELKNKSEFEMRMGYALVDKQKYNRSVELAQDAAKEFANSPGLWNEFKKEYERAKQTIESKSKKNIDLKYAHLKIFKILFNGVRSRNYEICKLPGTAKKNYASQNDIVATIGPTGFGLRRNIQSSQIDGLDELDLLIEHKEDVILGLKKMRLHKVASNFKKFCDLKPPEIKSPDPVVKLKKPLLYVSESGHTVEKIYYIDPSKLKVWNYVHLLSETRSDSYHGNYELDDGTTLQNRTTVSNEAESAFTKVLAIQLGGQLHEATKTYIAKYEAYEQSLENHLNKMRAEFAAELLMHDI